MWGSGGPEAPLYHAGAATLPSMCTRWLVWHRVILASSGLLCLCWAALLKKALFPCYHVSCFVRSALPSFSYHLISETILWKTSYTSSLGGQLYRKLKWIEKSCVNHDLWFSSDILSTEMSPIAADLWCQMWFFYFYFFVCSLALWQAHAVLRQVDPRRFWSRH